MSRNERLEKLRRIDQAQGDMYRAMFLRGRIPFGTMKDLLDKFQLQSLAAEQRIVAGREARVRSAGGGES